MTKSINEKWDENPAYYKEFSERIEETLQAYKDKRISEREYFDRMNDMKDKYQKGESGIIYPDNIKDEPNAQAFYGVTADIIKEADEAYGVEKSKNLSQEQIAELSILIENIVNENTKRDWHDNIDVHNTIEQEIEDLLFDFAYENNIDLDFDQIDKILKEIKTVALSRY